MDIDQVVTIGRDALYVTLVVAAPVLLVGLGVGLVVGMFQAATQIQEMTLTFIPKVLGMAVALAVVGGWMIDTLVGFTVRLFERIPYIVG